MAAQEIRRAALGDGPGGGDHRLRLAHDGRPLPFSDADPSGTPETPATRTAPAKSELDGRVGTGCLERAPESRRWPLAIPFPIPGIVVLPELLDRFLLGP